MSKIEMHDDYLKTLKVIKSIKKFEQFHSAKRYARLFFSKWEKDLKNEEKLIFDMRVEILSTLKIVIKTLS